MQIDANALSTRLQADDKPFLLDVREPQEVTAEGIIEGALHIPMNGVPARIGELPRDREIVAVCKRGQRSWNVAAWLKQQGFQALSLAGGLDAWRAAGLPVARR